MQRRRFDFEPAYVLASRSYRETSVLLEVFSSNHGRTGLVARGARGPKSRLRGLLQPFTPLLLSWTETGELGSLAAAEADGPAVALVGEAVFYGWYVNELLLKLLQRHDPHPALYLDYRAVLPPLATERAEPALRNFELRLLAELGYGLDLDQDFEPAAAYRYDFEAGPQKALPGDLAAFGGASLIALRDNRLIGADAGVQRDARRLMRAALRRQLGGRELETPRLLRALRERGRPG